MKFKNFFKYEFITKSDTKKLHHLFSLFGENNKINSSLKYIP